MTAEQQLLALVARGAAGGPTDLARLCLFDWIACAMAALDEDVSRILRTVAAGQPVQASVIGGTMASITDAALINGTTGHALDYDDTHFDHIGHTSAVIMPAVLALAEGAGITDMSRIADAALLGSEAALRVGLWLGRDHYQLGYHQTATSGAFGAALAGAFLLSLSEQETNNAIGLCATATAGLKGQFGTMGKPLNAGLAARNAVQAVLWAQAGMTSDQTGLAQFGATHHGINDATAWDLGEPWKFKRVSHKFHACCHGLHAMLEALRGIDGPVDSLQVQTHPRWLTVCNKPDPQTGLEAKFSYKTTAAMSLSGINTADIASFSDANAGDPVIRQLADKVTVCGNDSLSEMQAIVDVVYQDGRHARRTHDLETPLDMVTRERRLRAKAQVLIGAQADRLWAAVQSDDLSQVTQLWQA